MRYFRSGLRIVLVHTDAPFGEDFINAKAEVRSLRRDRWVERPPNMTSAIMFTGDWNPCTEAEARDVIERRMKRLAEFA
jgi:hypothetical protein